MRPETLAIHAPRRRDGDVAAPLRLTTTFEHGPANEPLHDHTYVRQSNPNVVDLEARLSAMEGGAGALAYGSGMAACAGLFAALDDGATVLLHEDTYYDVRRLAAFPRWRALKADLRDLDAVDAALAEGVALVFLETPSNPRLHVLDVAAVAARAHAAGALVAVDNTFATPVLQRPLELGADVVVHALTKYMGGHSDVQGGALIVRDAERLARLLEIRTLTGGVLAPFNAWLVARGLQTLHVRIAKHAANAAAIAEALNGHPNVDRVRYPFLAGAPGEAVARKQMASGGGIVSIEVKGGRAAALKAAGAVRLFRNATSFGGVESLLEHRASVEGEHSVSPPGLIRLAVGLEHPDDLIEDLDRALRA